MMSQIFTTLFGRTPSSDMTPRQMAGHILARLSEERAAAPVDMRHSYEAPNVITSIRVNGMDYHGVAQLDEFLSGLGLGDDVDSAIKALRLTGSFSLMNDLNAQCKMLQRELRKHIGHAQTMAPAPIHTAEVVSAL